MQIENMRDELHLSLSDSRTRKSSYSERPLKVEGGVAYRSCGRNDK